MESSEDKTPRSIESIQADIERDPVLAEAIKKHPVFMSRLEGAMSYDDIISAVEKAAVDDGMGEKVVFDIEGYEEGYEDEKIEAWTVSLSDLISAIEFVRDNGVKDYEEIKKSVINIHVANAVSAVWVTELPLTEEQIVP